MNITTAITIFVKKMIRDNRISFDVSIDPFYFERNMNYLRKVISDIETGKSKIVEHDLQTEYCNSSFSEYICCN